jgi:hypothetical protein
MAEAGTVGEKTWEVTHESQGESSAALVDLVSRVKSDNEFPSPVEFKQKQLHS